MKLLQFFSILLVVSLLNTSCTKDEPVTSNTTLKGKVRGADFTFGSARYGSITNTKYRVIVSNAGPKIVESCDTNTKDVYLDFNPLKTTDRIELDAKGFSTGQNRIVFHSPNSFQNLIVDRTGFYQITEENDSTLVINVDVRYDDDNYVKGSFIATKCF